MLTLPTSKAAPGMTLAVAVLHPEKPGHVLLKPGCVLDATSIARLRELGVQRIGIEYMPTAFLLRYANAQIVNESGRVAQRVSKELDAMTSDLHADFDCQVFVDSVRSLIQRLVDEPQAALFMHDIVDARKPLAAHAFNVGLLSLLMGLKLDGWLVPSKARLTRGATAHVGAGGSAGTHGPVRALHIESLGLGALLHDIGMTRLPQAVTDRFETTRDESDLAWRKHVLLGFNLVKGRLPATASAAVLHHHQRMDGSGFPARTRGFGPPTALRGEEIHVFSRIIAMADVFDRFRTPPSAPAEPGAAAPTPAFVPTVRALRRTLEMVRGGELDSVVFKALLAVTPAFAPGSIVVLSDGRKCVVTGWDPLRPCSPTVNVLPKALAAALSDASTMSLRDDEPLGEEINLATRRDLRVASIDGYNVLGDLFEPATPHEFDLRLACASPLGGASGETGAGWEAIIEATLAAGGKIG